MSVKPVKTHVQNMVHEVYDADKRHPECNQSNEGVAGGLVWLLEGGKGSKKEVRRLRWKLDIQFTSLLLFNVLLPGWMTWSVPVMLLESDFL